MNDVTDMPFDQYQRYRLVADILEQVRVSEGALDVLDVGGRTALLRRFLPGDEVALVDVEPSDSPGLVLGDGAKLPFQDASFDAVVTFDTLEHVPPQFRAAFLRECRRVSKNWVIIAGPYDTPGVAKAEEDLRVFLKEKLELDHRYLNEHHEHGLPSRDDTVSELMSLGGQVSSIGHGNLERWLVLMCLSIYMDHDAPLRSMASRFHKFYNRTLYASDHAGPVYRHAIVASFANAEPPTAKPILDPPVAPEGALERFRDLAQELLQFDVKRDVWQAEWDRLTEVNEGHLENIAGFEKRVASLEAELADVKRDFAESETAHEDVEAKLREDLVGHGERVKNLEEELAAVKVEHEKSESEAAEMKATLESDLAEHAASLKALQAEMAENVESYEAAIASHLETIAGLKLQVETHVSQAAVFQQEIDALVTHKSELEGELARLNEVANEIQENLVTSNEALHQSNLTIEAWRSELRSRKQNLKRALAFKKPEF